MEHIYHNVKSKLVTEYLEQNGFVFVPRKPSTVKCYQKIVLRELVQIDVPDNLKLIDYDEAMERAIKTIAQVQGISPMSLVVRFSDMVRIIGRVECSFLKGMQSDLLVKVVSVNENFSTKKVLVKVPDAYAKIITSACREKLMVDIIGRPCSRKEQSIDAEYVNLL